MIVTSSWDNTAKLEFEWFAFSRFESTQKIMFWIAVFSSDGTRLIIASIDKTAKVWDLKGKLLHDFEVPG